MRLNDCANGALTNLHAIVEQAMEQQAPPICLGAGPFEVDLNGIHPVYLLIGVGGAVSD